MNVLTLEVVQHAAAGEDWCIDGSSLSSWMSDWSAEAPVARSNGWLATRHPDDVMKLLSKPEPAKAGTRALVSGRVPLYVCSQCSDLDCAGDKYHRRLADRDVTLWGDHAISVPSLLRQRR